MRGMLIALIGAPLAVSALAALGFTWSDLGLFDYHPILAVFAFCVALPNGIYAASSARSLTGTARAAKVERHTWWNWTFALSLAGSMAAIVYNKLKKGRAHFTSWHGYLGLITCVLVFAVLYLGSQGHNNVDKPKGAMYKRWHRVLGALTFLCGMATMLLAMEKEWSYKMNGVLQTRVHESLLAALTALVIVPGFFKGTYNVLKLGALQWLCTAVVVVFGVASSNYVANLYAVPSA